MIEEIKNRLPNPMENYRKIAEKVSEKRDKPIAWRTVMLYLNGRDVSLSEGTGALIEEIALDVIRDNATESLRIVDEIKAAKVAA
jgi:hypothetical protein